MALTYRNTLKGHVVEVPEPADIIAAAEAEAERLLRKGTKRDRQDAEVLMDKAQSQAIHQRQTLAKMDESRRWERYTAPPAPAAPPHPPATELAEAPAAPARATKPPTKAVKAEPKPEAKSEGDKDA